MDDLISRTRLLNDLSYCPPELWQDEEYVKAKIIRQPAVNAIPVEWLKRRVMNAKYNGIKEAADAFDFVLNCWKEQEAR